MIERQLTTEEAVEIANGQEHGGRDRATQLVDALGDRNLLSLRTYSQDDVDRVFDLTWQEIPGTRFLTAPPRSRSLGSAAEAVIDRYGNFANLIARANEDNLDPTWFERCSRIEEQGWDWSAFRPPWLVPPTGSERQRNPNSDAYICEGNHSLLVLAVGLLTRRVPWQDFDAVVAQERGSC